MRVVIADDAVLIRSGVATLLAESGIETVGQAADADELVRLVADTRPDAAVVDIRMPPTHTDEGLHAARRIRHEHPDVGVLTPREREVLGLMAEGRSNATIGRLLSLQPKTVETHVGRVFSKLGLAEEAEGHRRVLAVLAYLRAERP